MRRPRILQLPTVLLALVFAAFLHSGCTPDQQVPGRPSLQQTVIKAGKIRCSYVSYPPYCIKDPNTGQMTGVFVDVLEKIGQKLELKIEWAEEVGWGTIIEGLESGRHDMFGAGLWENSARGKRLYFSKPLFYNAIRVWVRSDETRFKTLEDLNNPSVRLTTQDGALDEAIAKADFPKAKTVSIPQLNPWSDNLLNTVSGKADVSFSELASVTPFLEKNPGTLKELPIGRPVRVFANSYAFRNGEEEFKAMIDAAINELASEGTIERIVQRYENSPGELLRVAPPYRMPDGPK